MLVVACARYNKRYTRNCMVGYHLTYADRVPDILWDGLRPGLSLPMKMRTGMGLEPGVFFYTDPRMSSWIADDRNLNTEKDWVVLRVIRLNPRKLLPDPDNGILLRNPCGTGRLHMKERSRPETSRCSRKPKRRKQSTTINSGP